jgi:carbon-monoxide dehydrogenase large subunit
MSVMGTRVERVEDPTFLTSGGAYVADLRDPRLDGVAAVVFVRSTSAHARIESIDTSDARTAPGVLGVFTAADVDLAPLGAGIPGLLPDAMARSWLAADTVRYVGEPVAIVVAETSAQAEDAAEQVWVDYDPLRYHRGAAGRHRRVLLFPEHGSNTAMEIVRPHRRRALRRLRVVLRQDITNQRVAALPLEPRVRPRPATAAWCSGRARRTHTR